MNLTEVNETPFTEPESSHSSPNGKIPQEPNAENPLSLAPNPAGDFVTATLSEPQTATILVLDVSGNARIRKRIYYRAEVQLDIQTLEPGPYTVIAEYYGQTYSEKLLITR